MFRLILCLCSLFYLPTTAAYPMYANNGIHRSIIFFAPAFDQHVEQFELETLLHDCALTQRDVVTIIITRQGYTKPDWVKNHFNVNSLFKIFQINPNQHTAILIGKDGGEKMRWGKETNWHKVHQTIDKMPMRKREMLNKTDPCSI